MLDVLFFKVLFSSVSHSEFVVLIHGIPKIIISE